MSNGYSIAISTFADKESAKNTARMLVESRIAACVQILPIESVYMWNGEICGDSEVLMLIKSRTEAFDNIVSAIKKTHAYEIPEIIQVPITAGLPEYLSWIDEKIKF